MARLKTGGIEGPRGPSRMRDREFDSRGGTSAGAITLGIRGDLGYVGTRRSPQASDS